MGEQTIHIHGPYEDAIIAACALAGKIVDGQPPEIKAELWRRHLEITQPLHNAAVEAAKNIERFFRDITTGLK